jgi:hypothetical protein
MDDSQGRKFQKDLNAGLVSLVLLGVLDKSSEDLYGYEIAKRLASANEGTSIFKEGTIYPVLRAAITASPTRGAPCCTSGVRSGAKHARSSIFSLKEQTHERSPFDR